MGSLIEQRNSQASDCDESGQVTKRGLGPEFICPFGMLFFATILRKLLRHYHISLPYTVILMLVGAVLGGFYQYELIKRLTFIADLTPVQILAIFLPILIFESAFSCDPHIFIKCLGQILTLAILGFFISVALTTLAVMYWYENENTERVQTCWTWDQAVLYSAVVSATDPVSVVSLLKSMTSLKTLSTVIEGESLLNDAAAITIYTLVKNLIREAAKSDKYIMQKTRATLLGINAEQCDEAVRFLITRKITGIYLLKFILKTIAAAILIGYVMARITIVVLYRIEAGELETCITVTMSYFVYLTCESIEASGVIGVVLLGLTLNMNRACFSVSAIHISEQTWQLLGYIANSLIFITVGVILLKTYSGTDKMMSLVHSLPQLFLIYIILTIVRAIMILIIHFILKRIAYGFTWKDAIVTIWSGLRGGVSLVLALTLFNSNFKDKYQAETMLIHTTAIVFLTCTVNAITIPSIVHILHMDQTSELIKQTLTQVMKELKMKQNEMIRRLKRNRILATADWLFVQKTIEIKSPYDNKDKEEGYTGENVLNSRHVDMVKCDHCQAHVTVPISKFEFKETFEDCRVRVLRLQKTHFWLDYYNGQLSSYGLHTLNSLCDRAIDTPKQFIDLKTVKAHIVGKGRVRALLSRLRTWTRQWQTAVPWYHHTSQRHRDKISSDTGSLHVSHEHANVPKQHRWCLTWFKKFFSRSSVCFTLVFIECAIVIYQLHTNLCNAQSRRRLITLSLSLEILSLVLLVFDYAQLFSWLHLRKKRRYRPMIIIYTSAITCRLLSSIIHLSIFMSDFSRSLCIVFYIFKGLSLFECIILSLFLIEPLQFFVDYTLNRYISVSYDIGLAYISSEEQVLKTIHRLTNHESIHVRIRELALQHIKSILNDVLTMQEHHPGTVISVKTRHTLNLLYNTAKRGIAQVRSRGVLDDDDCDLLERSLKSMHNHIRIPSTMPPASPIMAIRRLAWLVSSQCLTIDQTKQIEQILIRALPDENPKRFVNESFLHPQSFSWQDFLWHKNDKMNGVYLLVSGTVEEWTLDPNDIDAYNAELRWKESTRMRRTTTPTDDRTEFDNRQSLHLPSQHSRSMDSLLSSPRQDSREKRIDKNSDSASSHNNIEEPPTHTTDDLLQFTEMRTSGEALAETDFLSEHHPTSITSVLPRDAMTINTELPRLVRPSGHHRLSTATGVRIAFEDGFYTRWHHLMTNSVEDELTDSSTARVDDGGEIDENFDQYFDKTFEKYRLMHPATSERTHRRYSHSWGDCIGLYDFLVTNGEKHESTGKCLTNVTVFFISKEKLFQIFNTYSLWNVVWLEVAMHLALRILPNLRIFQRSSIKLHNNHSGVDFDLIDRRLSMAGLLIYDQTICSTENIVHLHDDLLLVAGSLRNQMTKCIYEAPIFIARSLSKQGLKLLDDRTMTKILVLPRTITTTKKNRNLFRDSSLQRRILDNETLRDPNRNPIRSEQMMINDMRTSKEINRKQPTCPTQDIDDVNQHSQLTTNLSQIMLDTVPKIHMTKSIRNTDMSTFDIQSDLSTASNQTFDISSSDYQTARPP